MNCELLYTEWFLSLNPGKNLCIYYILSDLIENPWDRWYYPHLQTRKVKLRRLKYCQLFFTIREGFCQAATTLISLLFLQDLSQSLAHSQAMVLKVCLLNKQHLHYLGLVRNVNYQALLHMYWIEIWVGPNSPHDSGALKFWATEWMFIKSRKTVKMLNPKLKVLVEGNGLI